MKGLFIQGIRLSSFSLVFIFLGFVGASFGQGYPSIPGNPTTLENSNSPDPFYGTFKNGGAITYEINSSFVNGNGRPNAVFCIDRSTPVCDGTKNPLSLGSTPNADAKLAYALYLAQTWGGVAGTAGQDVTRNLIWAVMGQANTCSSNAVCSALYNEVQLYSSSSTFSYNTSYSPVQSSYKVGDKIVFEITTNLSRFVSPGIGIDNTTSSEWPPIAVNFCDASGNIIPKPSSIDFISPYGGAMVWWGDAFKNNNAPAATTFHICMEFKATGSYIVYGGSTGNWANFTFGASDATIWTGSGCQPLVHLMPVPLRTPTFVNVTCDPITNVVATVDNANPSAGGYINFGVLATGTTAKTTYEWSGPNSFYSTSQTPDGYAPNTSGTHTYTVKVSNGATCTATGTVSLSIAGPCTPFGTLTAYANPATVAPNGSTTLLITGTGIDGGTTYSWSGPNSFPSTNNYPSVSPPSAVGTYTYSVTVQNVGTNTCTASTTAQVTVSNGSANLSLQKLVSKVNPNAGENIVYTVKITNAGPDTATNVKLKDLLPAGLTFVSVSAGSYVPATGLWTIGTVPVGTTTVTMTVTVN